jgi:predicted transcriptional regulator
VINMTEARRLDRGHLRARLIREIAGRTESYAQIAHRWGVTRSAVSQFAARHALAIADARADLDDSTAHLWVTHREARLAEIQQTIEDLDARLARDPADRAPLLRLRLQAIRQAAEETGQLRDTAPVHTVEIRLNGVDLDQLT